ncbi:MAG: hypothetical protein R6U63_06700 [Longimicrobiales bacterium]
MAGTFNTINYQKYTYTGFGPLLSNQSFQHTAPWANFGMEYYGRIPRQPVGNVQSHPEYGQIARSWNQTYKALSAAADGLRVIEDDADLAAELGDNKVQRLKAYAKFIQGTGHGMLALAYARGFVVDETTDLAEPQDAVDYNTMMEAALGYLDDAIALAGPGFGDQEPIPSQWMSVQVRSDELIEIAHSYKARFRANVARTPAERAAVDWAAVIADVDAGLQADWEMLLGADNGWHASGLRYSAIPGWSEMNYYINGMADQSGNYQRWLAQPLSERHPAPAGEDPILIMTDDLRFPQGADVATQKANPGTMYAIPCEDTEGNPAACEDTNWSISNVWARPDRGSWRWSYYWHTETADYAALIQELWPEITHDEMRLLKAEGLYRQGGQEATVAQMINVTREAAGLNATDAAGTNTSCVPKLADGTCGDLFEMLKWEKRQQTFFKGAFIAPWYFDGRGWGDLYEGTPLHYPIPCGDVQVLQLPSGCLTYGGDPSAEFSSPGSVYNFES